MQKTIANLGWLLSPTRKIIDKWKQGDKAHRGRTLRRWSVCLFAGEASGSVILSLICHDTKSNQFIWIGLLLCIYAFSRINEIAYAFYNDTLSPRKGSDLTVRDRIRMAMRSYLGLAFNFALLYFFLPVPSMFKEPLNGFFEALYFSGITLATVGYGDIFPTHWVSRLLCLYEASVGILLIAVAVASYIGHASDDESDGS